MLRCSYTLNRHCTGFLSVLGGFTRLALLVLHNPKGSTSSGVRAVFHNLLKHSAIMTNRQRGKASNLYRKACLWPTLHEIVGCVVHTFRLQTLFFLFMVFYWGLSGVLRTLFGFTLSALRGQCHQPYNCQ